MIRKIAFDALKKIIIDKQYANMVLKNIKHDNINLITFLIYGTLQHYDYCTYQWKDYAKTPVKKEIEILLNLAVYQRMFVDKAPDYAIVNETTKIANTLFDGRYKGLVNALLRKAMAQPIRIIEPTASLGELSVLFSFKEWVMTMWKKQYGYEKMIDFATSSNQAPSIYCKLNTLKTSKLPNDLELSETDVKGCYKATSEVLHHPAFITGEILIQDKNAQEVGHFIPIVPFERVLDGCAAPGGKSLSMAIKTNNQCEIVAVDIHPHRVELIQELVTKTNATSIIPLQANIIEYAKTQPTQSFDGVLIDAPCSGLGVLKRKPEIKMFLQPEDIDSLVILQREILDSVTDLIRVNGWLVYATCTLNTKENEKQAAYFIENYPNYVQEDEQFCDPSQTSADGFYMVKFKRIS
jgi:16S rRNA (cytosine967-C5)-methyltransferase